jgi:N-acyl-D-amino-acid deacylase
MGNCGVGFAPVRPGKEEWLIQLMEGVEDIPGSALAEGIKWGWESFGEYLTAIEGMSRSIDVATQVPHGAVRGYVMGDRGAQNEPATPADIEAMAEVVRAGMLAGALGFSTSRTTLHTAVDGEPVPGTFAAEDELFGIGRVLGELGTGVIELAPAGVMGEDLLAPASEVAWMRKLSAETGRPISFGLSQHNHEPEAWREVLRLTEEAIKDGADLRPQVSGRPLNLLIGWQTFHPFATRETYLKIADHLPDGRAPELRARRQRQRGRHRRSAEPSGRGSSLRPHDGARRPRAADVCAARLLLRQLGRRAGDARPPVDGPRAFRRRCACRGGVRREHADFHADPLGTRSAL